MHRVFNGMDLGNFQPAAPAPAERPVQILSIGRLIEFKGFHHLIPACATLRAGGLRFTCDILGEGPWREQLQGQIEALGLSEQVRLRGAVPQEEVFAALRGCDIFTLPCTTDRLGATDVFPTVILEAMASGKPVLSTRLAGVPEQIESGVSGVLVEPGDEAALAEALAELVASPERRRALGEAGRRRLEQEFSVERTVLPLQALFQQHAAPAPPVAETPARLGYFSAEWPGSEAAACELRQLREAVPGLRIFAVEAASGTPPLALAPCLPHLDFLPDGMVLEGEWQQERELARRMETWRLELGQKLTSERFLTHARQALYLRRLVQERGVRHLHLASARELLTGWLLHRLTGTTLSLTLAERPARMSGTLLAKLVSACLSIRCSLPEKEWAPVKAELKQETEVVYTKAGRPFESEWLARVVRCL